MQTIPFCEKYRPKTLDEIESNHVKNIERIIDNHKLPHLLFYGPSGTGKTSTIMACGRKIYGERYKSMILELNGSDDRGINIVRQNIKEFVTTNKLFQSGVKLVILDEVDSMTYDAQFALRRVIETYTYNARFCLICNYINKIIPALQSRCLKFKFNALIDTDLKRKLQFIMQKENIITTDEATDTIVRLSEGDLRKGTNIVQMMSTSSEIIDDKEVYRTLSYPHHQDIDKIWNLLSKDLNSSFQLFKIIDDNGYLLKDVITEISKKLIKSDYEFTKKMKIIPVLAKIEVDSCDTENIRLYIAGLISIFRINL